MTEPWSYLLIAVLLVTPIVWMAILSFRVKAKPTLVIEPLGVLIKDWQVARLEPNNQAVASLFKTIASAHTSSGSILEAIASKAAAKLRLKSKLNPAHLLDQTTIGPMSARLTLQVGTKTQSIVVGPLGQVEALIDSESLAGWHHLSEQAAEHGYLALALATTFIHGHSKKSLKHELVGLVILEPVLNQTELMAIRAAGFNQIRFLTVGPANFARHLYHQIFPNQKHFGLNAKELETLPPKFAEADCDKARFIGAADLTERHRILRTWQRIGECVVVSVNPDDQELPVTPIAQLP